MTTVLDVALLSAVALSVLSNFYGLPGNFMIPVTSFFYGLTTGFDNFSFSFVLGLLGIALLLEFLEYLLISFTAKKYGSSRWGISGAIFGGILGAVSGAFITPVLGAIIGSISGVFIGAVVLEFVNKNKIKESVLAGFGAFLGKLGGLSIKVIGGVTMAIMVFSKII